MGTAFSTFSAKLFGWSFLEPPDAAMAIAAVPPRTAMEMYSLAIFLPKMTLEKRVGEQAAGATSSRRVLGHGVGR